MFQNDTYAKIWSVEDKGNYTVCQISTSKKNKQTGKYETDFADKVRFVGKAHGQRPQAEQKIKLLNTAVGNRYDKEKKKTYYSFVVFDYSLEGEQPAQYTAIEEDLPFIL